MSGRGLIDLQPFPTKLLKLKRSKRDCVGLAKRFHPAADSSINTHQSAMRTVGDKLAPNNDSLDSLNDSRTPLLNDSIESMETDVVVGKVSYSLNLSSCFLWLS